MNYKKIVTLIINHQYYRDSRCNNFAIEPDTLTEKFMKNNSVVVRYIDNSWMLLTDIDKDSLWMPIEFENDTIELKFTLMSSDKKYYESIEQKSRVDGINCICNKKETSVIDGISCAVKECTQWHKKKIIKGSMYWIICLNFNKKKFLTKNHQYQISFNVKKVYWKYIVFNTNIQDNIEIIDVDSRIRFIKDKNEEYPNGKSALTFISDQKMPLSENDEHNFRLVVKRGKIEKNLIKRLPVATPSGVQYKDSINKELVSLLFINT